MDFIDNLNESWELRFEEVGETGDPVFVLQDIDNDIWHRFYPEDLKIFMNFLTLINKNPNGSKGTDINESYSLFYVDNTLILKDIDNNDEFNFYPEDIEKINVFLKRLKEFRVIKFN